MWYSLSRQTWKWGIMFQYFFHQYFRKLIFMYIILIYLSKEYFHYKNLLSLFKKVGFITVKTFITFNCYNVDWYHPGMMSACTNPILYGFLNENFKKEFKEMFGKVKSILSVRESSEGPVTTIVLWVDCTNVCLLYQNETQNGVEFYLFYWKFVEFFQKIKINLKCCTINIYDWWNRSLKIKKTKE